MYRYDAVDQRLVDERVAEFRDQVARHIGGQLGEDEFRSLRLKNGLYHQLHAYMLRIAIPYGLLSSTQLHMLAHVTRTYDKGSGHFTTRQNLQLNWQELERVPDLLADLAKVEMHALQTSGNCVRNITADHFAGIADDEIEDPRPWCEILRQYSTLHPEFSYLPRKFKIAFTGALHDRALVWFHDIGFALVKNAAGDVGFKVIVGGGLGRTPKIGLVVREFLEKWHLRSYTEAILRVYNLEGNREQSFKARIKILAHELGRDEFARRVDEVFAHGLKDGPLTITADEIARFTSAFAPPAYEVLADDVTEERGDPRFARWLKRNVKPHKVPGYAVVVVPLKSRARAPGDMTAGEMDFVADLAERFSFARVRPTHDQNLVLSDVRKRDLHDVWLALATHDLAVPNTGTLQDLICCPGGDYCNLANTTSIPVARAIQERFDDLDYLYDLGPIELKMSGCINSCGHHHVGHIGILGIDMRGEEYFQIMLGGSDNEDAALGRWIGQAVSKAEVVPAVEKLIETYVKVRRDPEETFLQVVRRAGIKPFAEQVYGR